MEAPAQAPAVVKVAPQPFVVRNAHMKGGGKATIDLRSQALGGHPAAPQAATAPAATPKLVNAAPSFTLSLKAVVVEVWIPIVICAMCSRVCRK